MAADPNKIKQVKDVGRKDVLFSLARQTESSRMFVGSSDGKVYDIDPLAEKPEPKELSGHSGYVMGAALTEKHLVTGAYDRRLIWWDVETRKQVREVKAHDKWIRSVSLTPDKTTLVTVADDMVCRLWDAESGKQLKELRGHKPKTPNHFPSMLYCTAISRDGKLLATADKVGHIVVWDIASGKQLAAVEAPTMYTWDPKARIHSIGGVRSLAFSPDAKLLAAGGIGQIGNIDHLGSGSRLEVFDWQKGEKTFEHQSDKFKGLIEHLEFHPDGAWLFAAGGDHNGFYRFFDLANKKVIKEDKAPMHVHDVAFNESYDTIYAVGHGKIVVWKLG